MGKEIAGRGVWLERGAGEVHVGLLRGTPPFVPVAGGAGGDHVVPFVFAPSMAGDDVVYGELFGFAPAILAGVIIPPQDFPFGGAEAGAGAFDEVAEADDGGDFKFGVVGADGATAVEDEFGFARQQETQGTFGVADVQWFKVDIEDEDRCGDVSWFLVHGCLVTVCSKEPMANPSWLACLFLPQG
jgi:hypothetical protein